MCDHDPRVVFKAEIVSVRWEVDRGTVLPSCPAVPGGSLPALRAPAPHGDPAACHCAAFRGANVEDSPTPPVGGSDGWDANSVVTVGLTLITEGHDQNEKIMGIKKKFLSN